jgi:type I site-specific restriction-modification system R (restriction) subunit
MFAVNKAIDKTITAVGGDGKIGVVWHTQGSGKSMEMAFYTAKAMTQPILRNPTVVVLTDRIDLDSQLFLTFAAGDLLPETPVQADTKEQLVRMLDRPSGGIIFTTLQKFHRPRADIEAGIASRCCPSGATCWSLSTRRAAATTTSSTGTPRTCTTRCLTRRSSPSPARRSRPRK